MSMNGAAGQAARMRETATPDEDGICTVCGRPSGEGMMCAKCVREVEAADERSFELNQARTRDVFE